MLKPSCLILRCWWLAGNWIWGCIGGPGCPIWSQSGTNLVHNCTQDAQKREKCRKNSEITEPFKNTMLQHLFVGQSGAKVGQFGVKMAPIWGIIVSRMPKKSKKCRKNTQITELYKHTMLQDLFVGQKGPKSGSALGHPFGLETKLWRVPGHP